MKSGFGNMPKLDMSVEIIEAFAAFPAQQRDVLLKLRDIIVSVSNSSSQTGELVETLKWGQPSYATARPVTGSPIRLGVNKKDLPTLYCHCQTTLIQEFRDQFAEIFEFEGNRALVLRGDVESVREELRTCIARALSYRL